MHLDEEAGINSTRAGDVDTRTQAELFVERERLAGDFNALINYKALRRDALLSIPTPEHYLPLLYALGSRLEGETVQFPVEGVDGGSISMLSVQVGKRFIRRTCA
jgi:4,5-DOPA dioxygenase extradiol